MPQVPSVSQSVYDDAGYPVNAAHTTAVPTGVGSTVAKNAPGRLINALVTAAASAGSDNATITDAGPGGSGAVIAVIPGTAVVGTQIAINMPAQYGITATNVSGGPAFTIGWS